MTTRYDAAINEMFAAFWQAWQAGAPAVVGYLPDVRWPNVERRDKPDGDAYWARVSQQTVIEEQTSLSTQVSGKGKRRYTANGLVFVQIFCPVGDAQGMEKGRSLSIVARNAFRGKQTPGGVLFRRVRINELPSEQKYLRFNVVAEYEYDEIG